MWEEDSMEINFVSYGSAPIWQIMLRQEARNGDQNTMHCDNIPAD